MKFRLVERTIRANLSLQDKYIRIYEHPERRFRMVYRMQWGYSIG